MSDERELLSRVRWRSRRGMMELDLLLRRYLDQRWAQADAAERASYLRLLDCEDTRLWPGCSAASARRIRSWMR